MRFITGQLSQQVVSGSSAFRLTFLVISLLVLPVCPAFADKVELRPAEGVTRTELFTDLRRELMDEAKPETGFEARRQASRASTLVKDVLNSKGYYAPSVTMLVETQTGFQPVLLLDPGPRFTLDTVDVEFVGPSPREEDAVKARKIVNIKSGDTAIPGEVIHQESRIVSELRAAGYPFAEAETRRVIGDREAATLAITYQIRSGPRVRFGEVRYPHDMRTKASYLKRLETFATGDLYTPEKLAQFSGRLDETRLYRISNARLAPAPSRITDEGDEVRDVMVTLTERKRNTIEAGVSLSTDQGPGLSSQLTRRNLTGRGDDLVASFDMTTIEQTLDLQWRRPNEFGYNRGLVFGAALSNEDTDAYARHSFTLSGGYEVRTGREFSYGVGARASYIIESDQFGERDLQLIGLYANARLDRTDSLLNPTRGWRAEARVEPSVSFGGDETQFVRSVAQVRGYFPVRDDPSLVLAGRLKAGTVTGADVESLPSESRFFAGGGGSVRGYGYQEIGPRAADNTPLGGRSTLEAAVEARWQVRDKIGVVAFIDAGSVTTGEIPALSDLRSGAGVGVRYETVAGPLRIDIAAPLDRTKNDDPFQIYISLGQAF